MATTIIQGIKVDGGRYQPTNSVDWGELGSSPYATWANWTSWTPSPDYIQIRIDDDLGSSLARTPLIQIVSLGEVTLTLKISDTGLFAGEETTISFIDDGTEYIYPSGRYYRWSVRIDTDSNLTVPYLEEPTTSYSTVEDTETFRTVDTAGLTGTIDARVVDSDIAVVTTFVATAHQGGTTYSNQLLRDRVYAVPDDYVFQENAIIVNIVSKSPPTIRCFDLNGESIDAVVDMIVTGLPKIKQTPQGIIQA